MQPIWTLNGRDSILLPLASDYLKLSDQQMRYQILTMHKQTQEILKIKGLEYGSLRKALTPQTNRFEYAFIFDSTRIASGAYGLEIADRILSSIDRPHNCSILSGDLIHDDQDVALKLLNRHVILHRSCRIQDTMQLFCVYLNNLSRAMSEGIHQRLLTYEPYIGRVETTYSSAMKTYLSATIGPTYLKVGHKMICGNEDETPNDENVNTRLWALEENGYECLSILSIYFDLFLSYKIERAIYPGFERDTTYALSAITDLPRPLLDFNVVVTESKMGDFCISIRQGWNSKAGGYRRHHNFRARRNDCIKNRTQLHLYSYTQRSDHARWRRAPGPDENRCGRPVPTSVPLGAVSP